MFSPSRIISCVKPQITNPYQVLLKLEYIAVCADDLLLIQYRRHAARNIVPDSLQHNFTGTVANVGADVQVLEPGDKVVVDRYRECGICSSCQAFIFEKCKNISHTCLIKQWLIAYVNQIYKLPSNVSLMEGIMMKPLSLIARALDRLSPIAIGKKILIIEIGIIGQLWASVLRLQGHKNVSICNTNKKKPRPELGYKYISNCETILNEPWDIIIECSGDKEVLNNVFYHLNSGGTYCISGISSPDAEVEINPFTICLSELKIVGVRANKIDFKRSIDLFQSLKDPYLQWDEVNFKMFILKDYDQAIKEIEEGKIVKAIFKF